MLYVDFASKIKEVAISQDEETELWYVEPEWVNIIHREGLGDLEDLEDSYITDWLDVEDMLKLEVERRNLKSKLKFNAVIDWLYETITATVEPAMLEEESAYIKNVVEFMKANHEKDNIVPFPTNQGE
jgi:hypothetical protein